MEETIDKKELDMDLFAMVNDHHDETFQRNNYIKGAVKNSKEKEPKRIKKSGIKKPIKMALITGAIVATLAAGKFAKKQFVGSINLGNELHAQMSEAGLAYQDHSTGYVFNQGDSIISYEEAINKISKIAEATFGDDETKTAVALETVFTDEVAQDVLGEDNYPSLAERIATRDNAYKEGLSKEGVSK